MISEVEEAMRRYYLTDKVEEAIETLLPKR